MGQRPKELTPYESPEHYWGAELRATRAARGMALAELAGRLHCDSSYLGKIERGERPIPPRLAEHCDEVLDAGGALGRLHALVEAMRDETVRVWGRAGLDVVHEGVDVACQAGTLAGKAPLAVALEAVDAGRSWWCRLVPRRGR